MTDSAQAALAEVLAIPGFPPNRRNGKFKEEKKKKKKKSSRKPKTDASKPTRDFEGLFYEDRNPHESDGDSDDARRALIDDLAHQEPDSDDDEVSQIVKKKKPEPAPLAPGDLADQLVFLHSRLESACRELGELAKRAQKSEEVKSHAGGGD